MPSVRRTNSLARQNKTGGKYQKSEAPAKPSDAELRRAKELEARRKIYRNDPKKFYCDLLAQDVIDRATKKKHRDSLGKIHDFLFDFLCFEMPGVKRYSALVKYLPKANWEGEYPERWIYWPRLNAIPEVQDGADGPISKMFDTKPWQGLVVRIKGTLNKATLIPRGHLKSEICTKGFTLWRMVRDPSERHMIRSIKQPLARAFLSGIKFHFESNDRFREVYGHLKPEKRDSAWNADFIQLNSDVRRGTDPTVEASGMKADSTGSHFDDITLDDVVAEKNTGGPENKLTIQTCDQISLLNAIRDPSAPLLDVGTRWDDEDAHKFFIKKDEAFYEDSSFLVATLLDDNPTGTCPSYCGIKGAGDPIWPEKYSPKEVMRKRRSMPIDKQFFGQYFNQFTNTAEKLFHADWITVYEGDPEKIARKYKCNIFAAFDTASGKIVQKGKFDPTGGVILGQSSANPADYFVLDGFKERIPADKIPDAIVSMCVRWQRLCNRMGTDFKAGFEGTAYTSFLGPLIQKELMMRGLDGFFEIVTLEHNNRSKEGRIRQLANPYSYKWIEWPEKLIVPRVGKGQPYDFVEAMRDEFVGYPMVVHEEILDAMAYAYEMSNPPDMPDDRPVPKKEGKQKDRYARGDEDDENETQAAMSGFGGTRENYGESLGGFDQ